MLSTHDYTLLKSRESGLRSGISDRHLRRASRRTRRQRLSAALVPARSRRSLVALRGRRGTASILATVARADQSDRAGHDDDFARADGIRARLAPGPPATLVHSVARHHHPVQPRVSGLLHELVSRCGPLPARRRRAAFGGSGARTRGRTARRRDVERRPGSRWFCCGAPPRRSIRRSARS
jgi:hypothetical protein